MKAECTLYFRFLPLSQLALFLKPLDQRPRSSRGWYFGATTGPSQQPFPVNRTEKCSYDATRVFIIANDVDVETSSEVLHFHLQDNKFPGAAEYQRVVAVSQVAPAYKPFGAVSPRFHPNQYFKPTPR